MAVTAQGSGTQTAVVGTEHTLLDVAVAGTFTLHVSGINLAAGDVVEIRTYSIMLTGGSREVTFFERLVGEQPADGDVYVMGPIGNDLTDAGSLRFTLKQTVGTARTFKWKVLSYA